MAIIENPENKPQAPSDLTESPEVRPVAPNDLAEQAEQAPVAPNNLTEQAEQLPATPNNLTKVAEQSPASPVNLPEQAEAKPSSPVNLPEVAEASPANPTNLAEVAESAPAAPANLTEQAENKPAAPANLAEQTESAPAAPNALAGVPVAPLNRTITPKLNLDFGSGNYAICGKPKALGDVVTYNRASNATFMNRRRSACGQKYEYFLDTDYNQTVTNSQTFSEQFNESAWVKIGGTVSPNKIKDPDGLKVGDLFIENTTSTVHVLSGAGSNYSPSDVLTASVLVKSFTGDRFVRLRAGDSGGFIGNAYFDIDAGVITSSSGVTSSIKYKGDGWFEIAITFVTTTGISNRVDMYLSEDGATASYVGNETSGIYVTRAQLTQSAKPLPYVKTLGAAASQTFAASPRIEYDPVTGECLGYLSEGASTNLILRSEEFNSSPTWVVTNSTINHNQAIAPDGTKSADKLEAASTASTWPVIQQAVATTAAANYTFSVYAKAAEARYIQFAWSAGDVAGDPVVNFNLIDGSIALSDSEIINSKIQNIGNGWYRLQATFEAATVGTVGFISLVGSGTATRAQPNSWTSGEGAYIWGAQVEALPFASSYIRTEGAAVSRSADSMSIDANIAPTITRPNTILGKAKTSANIDSGLATRLYNQGITSAGNRTFVTLGGTTGGHRYSLASDFNYPLSSSTNYKVALVYDGSPDVLQHINNTSGPLSGSPNPIVTEGDFFIGSRDGLVDHWQSTISKITLYDEALTAQEVEKL